MPPAAVVTELSFFKIGHKQVKLTLVLLNQKYPAFANSVDPDQLASEEQLIWICTVCHQVFEFKRTTWIK